jgi:asparagine synthase (glutamine-hydrolysing)
MCGIAGLLSSESHDLAGCVRDMADALTHRGPDGAGVWSDIEHGVALAHRRLAIVDLTPTGAQPMRSSDGKWVMIYNGEIYNAEKIAAKMPELVRRGTSDTEAIVESVARRGLERTIGELNGMFAIALWDRSEHRLHLIRDRLGIKPLFYGRRNGVFAFASELKAFHAAGLDFEIDPASITSFLRYGYVPAPYSIYCDVAKVQPGEWVSVSADGSIIRRKYWDLNSVARRGLDHPFGLSAEEAEDQLHSLLRDAISSAMVSDVPLGAFLSGGIDSSLVVALMVATRRAPVKTFSIGFPELGFDETPYARAVAQHLGTEHEELTVTPADALAVVPNLADIYDEPFADSSQIPTYLVSKMTRAHVAVALSGDGGDELFAGYNRYLLMQGPLGQVSRLPRVVRRALAYSLDVVPDAWIDCVGRNLPKSIRATQPADKLKKFAEILRLERDGIYQRLISQCPDPSTLTFGSQEHPLAAHWDKQDLGLLERMQLLDSMTYLPDDILQKVDRAAMAVSLEVRPPLLDHRLVEFAWQLPAQFRVHDGQGKWLLRRVLDRYVPRPLLERPKMGFAVPLAQWLRGPLREWAEDLLAPANVGSGFLDPKAVQNLWSEHLKGRNWAYALWTVLMFEAWRRRWHAERATYRGLSLGIG